LRIHYALLIALAIGACGGAQTEPAESPVAEPTEAMAVVVALRFVEGPEDPASGTPSTRVLLVDIDATRGRRTTDLGTYPGVCSHLATTEAALLRAQCFWAAVGSRLEVHRDNDALIVTRTVLDENRDDLGTNEVARIDLPPGAELDPMAPTTRLGD